MSKQMYRQGDVLITQVESLPEGELEQLPNCIVALGEATGHSHRVETGAVQYRGLDGTQYVHVLVENAELLHQEHGTINLKGPAIYRIGHQREYVPKASPRPVND